MTWKFWKSRNLIPPPAPRPASLGGAHTGKAPVNPDAKPPMTRGTLGAAPRVSFGFPGGELPSLAGLEPYTEAWRAKLQELLPEGAKVDISIAPNLPAQHLDVKAVLVPDPALRTAKSLVLPPDPEKRRRQDLKDFTYGQIASQIAQLGTCCRLKVGCVLLTKEGRVAGMGYNGAGPGMPHCTDTHCNENCRCIRTVHAEQNALNASSGVPYTAYVTNEPCLNCTKELALAGVRRVVYLHPYSSIAPAERDARKEWLDHYNIAWEQLPTSGAI